MKMKTSKTTKTSD